MEFAVQIAMALNCTVNPSFSFSRKTYFYPDLSKNYQITQYELPIGSKGEMKIDNKKIRITRVHLEEDPAALVHQGGYCLADYNRSGIPLVEIVTEPDFSSPAEAREFMDKLLNLLNFMNVFVHGEDVLKADCNVSLKGFERSEIKNVSGFRNIEKALSYEIERQTRLAEAGEKWGRETRGFDEERQITYGMRKKETEEDYGYIFEPDLTPITLDKKTLEEIQKKLPELPEQKSGRFQKKFGLKEYDANVLCGNKKIAELFEEIARTVSPKTTAVFLTREILGIIHYNKLEINEVELDASQLAELLELLEKGKVTEKNAKQAAIEYVLRHTPPKRFLEKEGLLLDLKTSDLEKTIERILRENPKAVTDLKNGNQKSLNFLVGLVMRETKGKAAPREVQKKIEERVKKT
jgi:aspartyl-tRNA(Asn)/glutamyl-tRNA(Gln) amidotransferase subunit B